MTNAIKTIWVQSITPALHFAINPQGQLINTMWKADGLGYVELAADRAAIVAKEKAALFTPSGALIFEAWFSEYRTRQADHARAESLQTDEYDKLINRQQVIEGDSDLRPAAHISYAGNGSASIMPHALESALSKEDVLKVMAAWDAGKDVSVLLNGRYNKTKGDSFPYPPIEAAAKVYLDPENIAINERLDEIEGEAFAFHLFLESAYVAVCLAPAFSLSDLQDKFTLAIAEPAQTNAGEHQHNREFIQSYQADLARLNPIKESEAA